MNPPAKPGVYLDEINIGGFDVKVSIVCEDYSELKEITMPII